MYTDRHHDISEHYRRFLWTQRLTGPLLDVIVMHHEKKKIQLQPFSLPCCSDSLMWELILKFRKIKKNENTLLFLFFFFSVSAMSIWLSRLPLSKETNQAYKTQGGSRNTKHVFGKQH